MRANLLVADETRTDGTICLAVSPSLKALGLPGRPRLFEARRKIAEINAERLARAPGHTFTGKSADADELARHPEYELDFIIAPPRMQCYIDYSTRVYDVYLKYAAPEDIIVYSIDEVFIDVTGYRALYKKTPHELAMTIVRDVLATTGITATAGIGTNLYLAKIAMDIVAKKMPADRDGVRIAELDEISYREKLWSHRPLTDFWRIGRGTAARLEANGMFTLGDVARMSLSQFGEDLLYRLFGVNAELIIDHAWGWEPVTVADVKAYRPRAESLSSGQVLPRPYSYSDALLVAREMADGLSYELVAKRLVTSQVVLNVDYDAKSLDDPARLAAYHGALASDPYGRPVPAHAHGTANLPLFTSAGSLIEKAVEELFGRVVDRGLLVRRINISTGPLRPEGDEGEPFRGEQMSLLEEREEETRAQRETERSLRRERRRQEAVLLIRRKYGKNAVVRGIDFDDAATARERAEQIGGHRK